jgi:hypothetical protein
VALELVSELLLVERAPRGRRGAALPLFLDHDIKDVMLCSADQRNGGGGPVGFRDDRQGAAACRVLLDRIPGTRGLWTDSGPTPGAVELMKNDGGPLSSGERVMLLAAFALWNGDGQLSVDDLLRLDGENLQAVGSLLVAMGTPMQPLDAYGVPVGAPRAVHPIDEWLAVWGGDPRTDAPIS